MYVSDALECTYFISFGCIPKCRVAGKGWQYFSVFRETAPPFSMLPVLIRCHFHSQIVNFFDIRYNKLYLWNGKHEKQRNKNINCIKSFYVSKDSIIIVQICPTTSGKMGRGPGAGSSKVGWRGEGWKKMCPMHVSTAHRECNHYVLQVYTNKMNSNNGRKLVQVMLQ